MTATHKFPPVQTIDKIPPLCLSLLTQFSPLIKYTANFIDIIEWKDTSKSTFVVLLWITICLWTHTWLIVGLPILFITRIVIDWLHTQITRRKRQDKEKQIYKEMRQEGQDSNKNKMLFEKDISRGILAQINGDNPSLEQTLEHLNHIQTWWCRESKQSNLSFFFSTSSSENNWIALTSTMIYVWPMWAIFNKFAGTRLVLMLLGSLVLIENAEWFKVIVMALKRNPVVFSVVHALWGYNVAIISYVTGLSFKIKGHPKDDIPKQESVPKMSLLSCHETYRCEVPLTIEIYENQRWWLGLDWTTNLLSGERNPWTDNQLQPIKSKESHSLPNDAFTVKTSNEKDTVIKRTTIKSWIWTDRDWWVDMTGELESKVDLNGWQYGNNSWQQFSSKQNSHTFTRQRRWCRRARLVERQVVEPENMIENKKNQ